MASSQGPPAQQMASQPYILAAPASAPAGIAAFAAVALAALAYPVAENLSRWPLTVALRHAAAAPNCTAARALGLAPAYRGQPGYYPQHDRDRDGIACEPWPRR